MQHRPSLFFYQAVAFAFACDLYSRVESGQRFFLFSRNSRLPRPFSVKLKTGKYLK